MPHALGPDPHPSEKRLDVLDLSSLPSLQSLPHLRLTFFPDDWKAESLDGHHSHQPLKKPHNSFHSRNCRLPRQTITYSKSCTPGNSRFIEEYTIQKHAKHCLWAEKICYHICKLFLKCMHKIYSTFCYFYLLSYYMLSHNFRCVKRRS